VDRSLIVKRLTIKYQRNRYERPVVALMQHETHVSDPFLGR
jgi:hypothetical protein